MERHTLSERQKKILKFIENFLAKHGYPPTIRDIGEAVDIASTSVVNYNLNKLADRGYIKREPKVSRGLWLANQEPPAKELHVGYADPASLIQIPLIWIFYKSNSQNWRRGNCSYEQLLRI